MCQALCGCCLRRHLQPVRLRPRNSCRGGNGLREAEPFPLEPQQQVGMARSQELASEAPGRGGVVLASRREPGCPTRLLPGSVEREKSDRYNHAFADNKMEIVFTGRVCFRLQQGVLPSVGRPGT